MEPASRADKCNVRAVKDVQVNRRQCDYTVRAKTIVVLQSAVAPGASGV